MPMLYSEMDRPSMLGIYQGLAKADFLHEAIVPLTCATETEAERVRRFFQALPTSVNVLWCEGPQVQEMFARLRERGLDLDGFRGKGLAVWLGFGAASDENYALAVHDADIERYDPKTIHRLLLPIVLDELSFSFAKGYYARLTQDRMYGRAVRLFVWPFIDALQRVLPKPSPLLSYLRSFRYPLSGEMALTSDLASNLRVPTDWGLELGVLGEVYRNASPKRVCQVDLGLYSHKHKEVGGDPTEGLQRMVMDLGTTVYRLLAASEGVHVTPEMLTALRVTYRREAQDAIRKYHADALVNALGYDRHEEEVVVERFEHLVAASGHQFLQTPFSDQISEWVRAISADPGVAADNA
jgi:glucosyl-3-phosphoglycerate synthase